LIQEGTAAILLAAGLSSRMGRIKALLPWKGRTLIQYQIEQLQAAGIGEVIVVLGYKAEQLLKEIAAYNVKAVINPHYEKGKSSSIRIGVSAMQSGERGILISAVDQPVPAKTIVLMFQHLQESGASVIIPAYRGKRGHPILFRCNLKSDLLHVNEETKGLRNVIHKHQDHIAFMDTNDPSVLYHFNKPEDYIKHLEGSNESIRN
jgi:molybdenum cofactor cytidylyltransferase